MTASRFVEFTIFRRGVFGRGRMRPLRCGVLIRLRGWVLAAFNTSPPGGADWARFKDSGIAHNASKIAQRGSGAAHSRVPTDGCAGGAQKCGKVADGSETLWVLPATEAKSRRLSLPSAPPVPSAPRLRGIVLGAFLQPVRHFSVAGLFAAQHPTQIETRHGSAGFALLV